MSNKIHPSAVISETAQIGENVVVGPNCYVDQGSVIGASCVLDANVVVGNNVTVGQGNRFYAGSVIGRPPQLLGLNDDTQFGTLTIGDNNTFREHVTIHPSMYPGESTKIGSDNLLMFGSHIGHDCTLEDKIVLSNYCQIGGHCKLEMGVWLSGMVAAHQFVTFGKWCYAAGFSGISHDVPPFVIISGHYPPEVRSINRRGLKRAGLTEEEQDCVIDAYKKIYKHDGGVFIERVKEIAADENIDPNVRYMVESIARSNEHRFGRYLETLRDQH